eukprot:TRINITY_DN782_c0_g1_i1.p1 TRINITY_DN782_c0_g1~~TRINITY_DN782_c0_g1_i1.p1  ORF type:complete len:410 (+),score=98.63 TRINITY_DN782_c0_g1_i1:81-1310(+)
MSRNRSRTPRGLASVDEGLDQGSSQCPISTSEILQVLQDRERARQSKDFATADNLRNELTTNGVTLWDKKSHWTTTDGRSGMIPMLDDGQAGFDAHAAGGGSDDANWIKHMVLQREQARAQKNFDESDRIRDELKERGVEIYDKEKIWKQASTGLQGCVLGYGNASKGPTDKEIHTLIVEREKARQDKDFAKSDMIRDELKSHGVVVLDKEKIWKSKDGRQGSLPSFDSIKGGGGGMAAAAPMAMRPTSNLDLSQTILNAAVVGQQSPLMAQQTLQLLAQIAAQSAAGAAPVLGGLGALGALGGLSPSLPPARVSKVVGGGSSPDMQKAFQMMRGAKQSGRPLSDGQIQWLLGTRERARAQKDFKGSDSMREALKTEAGIILLEREKRWQSNDGRGGAIPTWSELGIDK